MNFKIMDAMPYDICEVLFRYLDDTMDEFEPFKVYDTFEHAYDAIVNRDDVTVIKSEHMDYFTPAWHILVEKGLSKTHVEYRFYTHQING